MIRRHPHVFADAQVENAAEQTKAWEHHKAEERAAKSGSSASALDGVPVAMPALVRAQKTPAACRPGRFRLDRYLRCNR